MRRAHLNRRWALFILRLAPIYKTFSVLIQKYLLKLIMIRWIFLDMMFYCNGRLFNVYDYFG